MQLSKRLWFTTYQNNDGTGAFSLVVDNAAIDNLGDYTEVRLTRETALKLITAIVESGEYDDVPADFVEGLV